MLSCVMEVATYSVVGEYHFRYTRNIDSLSYCISGVPTHHQEGDLTDKIMRDMNDVH